MNLMPPKIYDCFCYFNEDIILELRLETLWDYIDHFVIGESTKTISGNDKSVNFDLEKFAKYRSKIRYLLLEYYPFDTCDPWRNERFQRDYLEKGLYDAEDDDWIMVSDIDEIPRPESICQFKPEKYLRGNFEQFAYSYYLKNICVENVRNFKSRGILRGFKRYWFRKFKDQYIANGGWHFTWIADISHIIRKLESYAHQEYNKPEYKDPTEIKQKLKRVMTC